ncbi:pyridoxamine kinase [Skermanella stibiiresistens SB22]|uniref:pyridoxal kinase n=1 Tax=Skermanella stibiiresistens SB22 TaxID=1385369 RepID=W9H4Q5_9PROT|nr:pyridoxal kinase PdxY [Skermanella stibiiresistens]EWY41205.1 pyridoxamine kinase [Skermanella stibiiresistens SB22]
MKQILTIQSHVAFGYVGNRAAVFPLQRLGFDAMAVNTVQFSNHTGYGSWTGQVFSPEHIAEVIDGIGQRGGLDHCDAILSGYMGGAALGQVIVETVRRVETANPAALYCCDPVMGDVGRGFFVNQDIRDFMRAHAVPAADIITPNQFELEFLTGTEIRSMDDALAATAAARGLGPKLVLLTSLTRAEADPDSIEMLLDSPDGAFLVTTPRLPFDKPPNGAGDCVAAVFLAKYLESGDAAGALGHAAAAIYAVFAATLKAGTRELQLIAAQDELVRPSRLFEVRPVR